MGSHGPVRQCKAGSSQPVASLKIGGEYGDRLGVACRLTRNLAEDHICAAAFAVAPTSGLDDGIERANRTELDGEINVHAGFDKLSGDEAARLAVGKPFADQLQLFQPVRRTEARGKVEAVLWWQQAEHLTSVSGGVEDTEKLPMRAELRGEVW